MYLSLIARKPCLKMMPIGGGNNFATLVLLVSLLAVVLSQNSFAQDCSGTSTGLVPLTDLGAGLYKGFAGGLYPDGENDIPAEHFAAGLQMMQKIQPLNAAGEPDPNGKIVLISIGMSNAKQEFAAFIPIAQAFPELNSKLVIVNGALASQDASKWSILNGNAWQNLATKLSEAGVTAQQVQVAWVKNAMPAALGPQTFPERAQWLQDFMKSGVVNLKTLYPNVRIAYLTSRIYAGYATTPLNPEPFAYEGGFAMKWLIGAQIEGDSTLAFDGPDPQAPWLAWGPYLWADGLGSDGVVGGVPGRSDGLEWECTDYQNDGTHPGPATGAPKVGQFLLDFFTTHPTAQPWFAPDFVTSVQLANFAAFSEGQDVVLRWSTSSGLNAYGFEIQRQSQGEAFRTLTFIRAKNATDERITYEYVDKGLQAGDYSYRIVQVDFDGSEKLSDVITLHVQAPNEFRLQANYPNPFRQSTSIFFQQPDRAFVRIRIYNILGQEVAQLLSGERDAGSHTIRWNGLDAHQNPVAYGIYFVTLTYQTPLGREKLVGRRKILRIR